MCHFYFNAKTKQFLICTEYTEDDPPFGVKGIFRANALIDELVGVMIE